MKICIIAEGSYPYVTGGVSSWIQMLMNNMKEHEFIIYSICAEDKQIGNYKYEFPDNVVEIKEVSLEAAIRRRPKWGKKLKFTEDEKKLLHDFIIGKTLGGRSFFDFVTKYKDISSEETLMSRDFYNLIKEICQDKFTHISFTDYFWNVRSIIITLLEVLKNDIPEADIYHSVSTGYSGVIAAYGKYLYGSKFLLTEHGIYSREREEEIIKSTWVKGYFKETWINYFHCLSKCAYESADKVVSLYNGARDIQIELGCNEKKTEVIANGISIDDYTNVTEKSEEEKDVINVGSVLRVVPIKDVKTILQAFAYANEYVKNLKFYIMGPTEEDEEYMKECLELVRYLKLDNVVFTGKINVKEYIGRMDILVLGSISEGQPISILEGMAVKKPHIATNVGSCSELLWGANDGIGKAGIIVPIMNYKVLGGSIVKLANNGPLRREYGRNAFRRVSRTYTFDNFIGGYKRLYNELMGV